MGKAVWEWKDNLGMWSTFLSAELALNMHSTSGSRYGFVFMIHLALRCFTSQFNVPSPEAAVWPPYSRDFQEQLCRLWWLDVLKHHVRTQGENYWCAIMLRFTKLHVGLLKFWILCIFPAADGDSARQAAQHALIFILTAQEWRRA